MWENERRKVLKLLLFVGAGGILLSEGADLWSIRDGKRKPSSDNQSDFTDALGAGGEALSKAGPLYDLVDQVDDRESIYRTDRFSGSSLDERVRGALNAMQSRVGGHGLVYVPQGRYRWESLLELNANRFDGPVFVVHPEATITIDSQWAFDLFSPDKLNKPRAKFIFLGGIWKSTANERLSGWIRSKDQYGVEVSPTELRNCSIGIWKRNIAGFSEGWYHHDMRFSDCRIGIRESIPNSSDTGKEEGWPTSSFDQTTHARLTFEGFETAIWREGSSSQCRPAPLLTFRSDREDATGIIFNGLNRGAGAGATTGTLYQPVWAGDDGRVLDTRHPNPPSVIDPRISGSNTRLYTEVEPHSTTAGQSWMHLHDAATMHWDPDSDRLPRPVESIGSYDGTLQKRIAAAVEDLPDGGTVFLPARDEYSLDHTITLDVTDENLAIATLPNTIVRVNTDRAFTVSGDGTCTIIGGAWLHGETGGTWLQSKATNLRVSPRLIREADRAIQAEPAGKGDHVIHDVFCNWVKHPLRIGGAGCRHLIIMNQTQRGFETAHRFDAPIENLEATRIVFTPHENEHVCVDTNASVSGTYFNPQDEAPKSGGGIVFDNRDADTVPGFIEGWFWGKEYELELWRGTKPRYWPDDYSRVDSALVPRPE
jgi:hypothetical protein